MGLFGKKTHHDEEQKVMTTTTTTTTAELQGGATVVTERDAIVNTVIDKPVLDQVIEKKDVEVHHVNVVREVHEQPIIEVEKTKQTKLVQEATEYKTVAHDQVTYEQNNQVVLSEEERRRLELAKEGKLGVSSSIEKTVDTQVKNIQDGEEVREVIIQPVIERHQQALVTEIHDQKIVEVHEHPVVRKIVEKPIIREIIHE